MTDFAKTVYTLVQKIPAGKVATYSSIAALTGDKKRARAVGNILHRNPSPIVVPCHRVVNANGSIAERFGFGGWSAQRGLLEREGIVFISERRVDLDKHLWDGQT